jgi:hypothetical protein
LSIRIVLLTTAWLAFYPVRAPAAEPTSPAIIQEGVGMREGRSAGLVQVGGSRRGDGRYRTIGARIVVNGRGVAYDVPPKIVNGTILVPLRFVGEALGATVSWDHRREIATIHGKGRDITAHIGDPILRVGDEQITASTYPRIIQGRTMVPLRAVAYALGATVHWEGETRTVSIRTPTDVATESPSNQTPASPLRVTVRAGQPVYRPGEPVRLTLEARNTGASPVTLQMSSGQKYDFEIYRGATMIWKWSEGRMFTQALTEVTIPPNEGVTYSETWSQRDRQERPVEPGEYTAVGYLTARGVELPRGRAQFRVAPATD